jgi:hypothetical protein
MTEKCSVLWYPSSPDQLGHEIMEKEFDQDKVRESGKMIWGELMTRGIQR